MFDTVISNSIETSVLCIGSEIRNGYFGASAPNEGLQLRLVKHAEPGGGDDGAEAFEEREGLEMRLYLEAMTGHVGDVDKAILISDGGRNP